MKTNLWMLVGSVVWTVVGGWVLSSSAFAGTVVVSKRNLVIPVTITPQNLHWSAADYQRPVVKVLVPELADVTILNHRNRNEGAPCLAVYDEKVTPEAVIAGRPNREPVRFQITLLKEATPDPTGQFCRVALIERLDARIRGFRFEHERSVEVQGRLLADCR